MKRWIHAAADYERYLADQHTADSDFGNPGYAESQSDEEIYGWVDSLAYSDATENRPQKEYDEFCKACDAEGIPCNQRWFRIYTQAYNQAIKVNACGVTGDTDDSIVGAREVECAESPEIPWSDWEYLDNGNDPYPSIVGSNGGKYDVVITDYSEAEGALPGGDFRAALWDNEENHYNEVHPDLNIDMVFKTLEDAKKAGEEFLKTH